MPVALIGIGIFVLVVASLAAVSNRTNPGPVVAVAAGIVAMIGFIFNAWFNDRQNRIKYTLDVYFQRYNNATYNDRATRFYEHRATIAAAQSEAALREAALADPLIADDLVQTVLYMLNYWEAVATVYVEDHLDRPAFDNLSGDLVCMVVERTSWLIGEKRRADSEYFVNLAALYWYAADPESRARLVPRLGPAPSRLPGSEQRRWSALAG